MRATDTVLRCDIVRRLEFVDLRLSCNGRVNHGDDLVELPGTPAPRAPHKPTCRLGAPGQEMIVRGRSASIRIRCARFKPLLPKANAGSRRVLIEDGSRRSPAAPCG